MCEFSRSLLQNYSKSQKIYVNKYKIIWLALCSALFSLCSSNIISSTINKYLRETYTKHLTRQCQ